jgi:hypothetical protein
MTKEEKRLQRWAYAKDSKPLSDQEKKQLKTAVLLCIIL